MVQWTVEVGGTAVDALQEVTTGSEDDGELGTARVIAANTTANRGINYSQETTVKRAGNVEYEGPIIKKPSLGRTSERIEFTVADGRGELKYIESHRPFYDMDPGAIIREAVTKAATVKTPEQVFDASSTTDWDGDMPEFGLVGADEQALQERGSDLLGLGFPEGTNGTFRAKYTSVPAAAIPGDGQVLRLSTRLLANSVGDQFDVEVELNDTAGNTYVWPVENLRSDFNVYTFAGEDAQTSSSIGTVDGTSGSLIYRVRLKGAISENRAIALDYADVLPFTLSSRSTGITTNNVQDVGTTITRRYDESVMEMLASLGEEFGHMSWVDSSDDLHFEPAGSTTANQQIDESSTPIIEANFDRDSERITNKVTVQGAEDANGRPIQVTASDNASINFYGLSEREEQIVDRSLKTQADVQRRAEGYLEDHAWQDVDFSFRIADGQYRQVQVGQLMLVTWTKEGISNETFTVSSKELHDDGSVTIGFTGSSA